VWGTSASDVWAVGAVGTIAHWDGARWSSVSSGTEIDLSDLWGSGPDDVWAVGSFDEVQYAINGPNGINDTPGFALHWDGTSWSTVDVGTDANLSGVWGSGRDDVWTIGTPHKVDGTEAVNVVMRWDGERWSQFAQLDGGLGFLTGIWGSGPDDVRVYGERYMRRFDGRSWVPDDLGTIGSVSRLSGTGPNDVWAVGNSLGAEFVDVYHFDGQSWVKATDDEPQLDGVWAAAPGVAWAVGQWGHMLRWDGHAWAAAEKDLTEGSRTFPGGLEAVWGSAADDVWAVGLNATLHWDGKTWASEPGPSGSVYALWGTSANDLWGIGATDGHSRAIFHWDRIAWTTFVSDGTADSPGSLTGIWGSGPNDVWAVGHLRYSTKALLYHWDGTSWSVDDTMTGYPGYLWGSGPNDVWAAGLGGVMHFDGATWSNTTIDQTKDFGPIWGASASDVWLAARSPDPAVTSTEVLRWNGSAWSPVIDGPKQTVQAFWGSRADDVWAIGGTDYELAFLHFDGRAWTASSPTTSGLEWVVGALWGSGAGDVWAVGGNQILYHRGR